MNNAPMVQVLHPLVRFVTYSLVVQMASKYMQRHLSSLPYPNQIHQQGRFEHPVQPHILIAQQIFQAAPRTVFSHNSKDPRVKEESQKQVQVLMPHVSKLGGSNHHVWIIYVPFIHPSTHYKAILLTLTKISSVMPLTFVTPLGHFFNQTQSPWMDKSMNNMHGQQSKAKEIFSPQRQQCLSCLVWRP